MNKDFEKGSILEFNTIGTIIVLGNLKYEEYLYVLVCPLKNKTNKVIESDLTKMILLKKGKDNELYTETDSKIIENIVPQILKKEKINLN